MTLKGRPKIDVPFWMNLISFWTSRRRFFAGFAWSTVKRLTSWPLILITHIKTMVVLLLLGYTVELEYLGSLPYINQTTA